MIRTIDDKTKYGFHEYSLQEDLEQLLLSMKLFSELLEDSNLIADGQFTTQHISFMLNMFSEQVYHSMNKAQHLEEQVAQRYEHITER